MRLQDFSRMKVGASEWGETPKHGGERARSGRFLREGGQW